jgi:hypothetical protein
MAKKERIFTNRTRKVFRNHIPRSEAGFGIFFLILVVVMGAWFFAQARNYDPSERDISTELMEEGSVSDTLYRTPLKRWTDPTMPATAGAQAAPELGIFPASLLDGGWSVSTRIQEFDESNLYEKINGAAPQYFQYGFVRLYYVGLTHSESGNEIGIELYDMGSFQNALGLFSAQRAADRAVISEGNTHYYETGIGAIGIAGPYYYKFTGSDSTDIIVTKSKQFVAMSTSLENGDAAPPRTFEVFAGMLDVPFEGISFEKSDVFQFQFATDFWFGRPESGGDLRYFVHEAASPEEAKALFDQLLENQLFDFELVEQWNEGVLLKHKFLQTYLAMEHIGSTLYGLDGATEDAVVDDTLTTLQVAFLNEEG